MQVSGPSLTAEEIRYVAREYRLRRPLEHREFSKGSPDVAKARLRSVDGDWMLKRRPAAEAPRLAPAHAFHAHLARKGCSVAPLRLNLDGQSVTVGLGSAFELFGWVDGARWTMATGEAGAIGFEVGSMLRAASSFLAPAGAADRSAHSWPAGVGVPAVVAAIRRSEGPEAAEAAEAHARSVTARAQAAFARAEAAGIADAPRIFVHGDLHPGNIRVSAGQVAAVVDFDESRTDIRAREVASAAFHFGNHPGSLEPGHASVPELDLGCVRALLTGVNRGLGIRLRDEERRALPWLMIESCAIEALTRIARTGRFGRLPAAEVLGFVDRKASWIESNAESIASL